VLLLLGGILGVSDDSMEVVSPSPACSTIINLNSERSFAVAQQLNEQVILCGGMSSSVTYRECESLDLTSWRWTFHSNMTRIRSQAAGLAINHVFYMIGGLDVDSTEFLAPHKAPFWQYGPNLPDGIKAIFGHCVVPWRDDGFLVIGGDVLTSSKSTSNAIMHFNTTSGEWTTFPSMLYKRRNHACVNLNDKIIVSGGDDGNDPHIGFSTEVLEPGATEFREVGRRPNSRIAAKLGIMDAGRILIIGGYDPESGRALDTVAEFEASTGKWRQLDQRLNAPRASHSLVALPNTICDSLPLGGK